MGLVAGAGAGALAGGMVGGPIGAGVGAVAGGLLGYFDGGAPQNQFSASLNPLQHGSSIYGDANTAFQNDANRNGPQANAATIGPVERYSGATIAGGPQAQTRDAQGQLISGLQARANGTGGPSVAELQMKQGQDAGLRSQLAAQAAQRGGANPLAQRNLAQNAAATNQQFVGQTADLRAQEQQQAQEQLGSVLSGVRGQDIGLATNQAGLDQQTGLAGMQAGNDRSTQNAQLQQQTRIANMDAQLRQQGMNDQDRQAMLASMFGVDRANQSDAQTTQALNAGVAGNNAAAQAAYQAGQTQMIGDTLDAYGKLKSDERSKTKITPGDVPGTSRGDKKAKRAALDDMLRKLDGDSELTRERDVSSTARPQPAAGQALDAPQFDFRSLYMKSDRKAKKQIASALRGAADRAESSSRTKTETNEEDTVTPAQRMARVKAEDAVENASRTATSSAAQKASPEQTQRLGMKDESGQLSLEDSMPVPYDTKRFQGSQFLKSDTKAKKDEIRLQGHDEALRAMLQNRPSNVPEQREAVIEGPPAPPVEAPLGRKRILPGEQSKFAPSDGAGTGQANKEALHQAVEENPDLIGRALDYLTGSKLYGGQVQTWAPYGVKPTGPVQDELDAGNPDVKSDERSKKNVSHVDMFLDKLTPYEYEYKDKQKNGSGRRLGVMAQDVRSGGPVGKSLVSTDPSDGMLQIDVKKGLGAALAGLGAVNDRLKKLETRKK